MRGWATGTGGLGTLLALLAACEGDGARDEGAAGRDAGADLEPLGCDEADRDEDGDGFAGCLDCDDHDPGVSPAVNEGFCCSTNLDDGVDNDCDGEIDETPPLRGCTCFEGDRDGDGYLDPFDCAPDDGDVNPGHTEGEPCSADRLDGRDNDCDGEIDESEGLCDWDMDRSPEGEDCDDHDNWVNPDRSENCCSCPNSANNYRALQCDGLDNDCDGQIDESPTCDCDAVDADRDGFRANDDCNDSDGTQNPGYIECCCTDMATFHCNERDDDCDGEIDDCSDTCRRP